MLRALIVVGLGLSSVACSGEATVGAVDAPCGWHVGALASMDGDGCWWSLRTIDVRIARLRSINGLPSEPVPLCEVETFARIDELRPGEVVEVWSPPNVTEARGAVEFTACR